MPKNNTSKRRVTKWEYRIEYMRYGGFQRGHLEKLGEAGWEMCGTVPTAAASSTLENNWPQTVMFYFKRPL